MCVYESHLGGYYTSDTRYSDDDLCCEQCGDSDEFIGDYDDIKDFLIEHADEFDIDGNGGYDLESQLENLLSLGEIELEEAEEIVRKNSCTNM